MKLLCDAMCGTLATYLRMCGHDAAYALDRGVEADGEVIALARDEDRRLVTRDRDLAERAGDRGLLVESRDVTGQLRELRAADVDLTLPDRPERCGACNGPLDPVSPDGTVPEYAPDPSAVACFRCRDCGQAFWKGSHWANVRERLASL